MRTDVKFLLLEAETSLLKCTMEKLIDLYRRNDRILVLCEDSQLLKQIDERLWYESHSNFIPYALEGECYQSNAKVLLTTTPKIGSSIRAMINIGVDIPQNLSGLREVIELVGCSDEDKKSARIRYKQYRQLGYNVTMTD